MAVTASEEMRRVAPYGSLILLVFAINVQAQQKIIVVKTGKVDFASIQDAINSLPRSFGVATITIDWVFNNKWKPADN